MMFLLSLNESVFTKIIIANKKPHFNCLAHIYKIKCYFYYLHFVSVAKKALYSLFYCFVFPDIERIFSVINDKITKKTTRIHIVITKTATEIVLRSKNG